MAYLNYSKWQEFHIHRNTWILITVVICRAVLNYPRKRTDLNISIKIWQFSQNTASNIYLLKIGG